MGDVPQCVLFEHAIGYTLFRVAEFEDIGMSIPQVEEAIADVQRFRSVVKLEAFEPFKNTEAALENCTSISEGQLHPDLLHFLEANLPRKKKRTVTLAVGDARLAVPISEQITGVKCQISGVVPELMRGIRIHFEHLVKDLPHHSLSKAQLSLGHGYSRKKVKFDVHRVDNMVIQSIALLDQLDKDINLFGMRIREWYSYHFPELVKLVPDQLSYIKCASTIMDRKNLNDEVVGKLNEILEDNDKVAEIVEAARTSMGMDIADLDLFNVDRFAKRVDELTAYRQKLHTYVRERMHSCAPSLSALIGEQVGARLISHAGSLTNLAKCPASTVQILGAEKALFRALKTRSNTPKYGLLFHSSFIGRASTKNKGRISRFLANKCTVASRIDCFSEIPVPTYGEHLKQQVEDRLKFLEGGAIPKKNLDVMKEAIDEASVIKIKILKKRKKEAKRAKRAAEQQAVEDFDTTQGSQPDADAMEVDEEIAEQKAKRPKLVSHEDINGEQEAHNNENITNGSHKKKKKKGNSKSVGDESIHMEENGGVMNEESSSKKRKKLSKKNDLEITASVDLLERPQGALSTLNEGGHKKKKKKRSME
uniref:Nucleolar protein 56 n=1 Tax=Elaeophora elaphi TaxID=1147741 RepID=A0A0R3RQB9_9BILA